MNKKLFLLKPNQEKKLSVSVNDKTYSRFPIRTERFIKGDDYPEKIAQSIEKFVPIDKLWFLGVSEKIVAISQGRSYFIKDIKPSFLAKKLSALVTKTPYGIGLGSPWTMELAIREVGLMRILLATLISALSRPLGIRGLFYKVAGRAAAAIDGPTEYSLYPSNVSAKLAPKNPEKAAAMIKQAIFNRLSGREKRSFQGVAIIDANDLGVNVLGNRTPLTERLIEKIFKDNPLGQASEQTPLALVIIK